MKSLAVLVLVLASASTAFAQAEGPSGRASQGRAEATPRVAYPKVTHLDLEGARIEGRRYVPWGHAFNVPEKRDFPAMIDERGSFAPELAKSLH